MPSYTPQRFSSPRVEAHRIRQLQKRRRTLIILSVLCVLLLGGLGYLIASPVFRITNVTIVGTEVLTTKEIQVTTDTYLNTRLLKIFSRGNILTRGQSLESYLRDTYPRIKSVNVYRSGFHGVHIAIEEYTQKYLWCGTDASAPLPNCYYVDEHGVLFSQAPAISGVVYVKLFTPLENPTIGNHALDDARFVTVATYVDQFTTAGLSPYALSCDDLRECVYYLTTVFDRTHQAIWIDTRRDPADVVHTLDSALHTEPLKARFKKDRSLLEYVDLRFDHKVYYRFTNG